jgi:hypothetical protein
MLAILFWPPFKKYFRLRLLASVDPGGNDPMPSSQTQTDQPAHVFMLSFPALLDPETGLPFDRTQTLEILSEILSGAYLPSPVPYMIE